MNQRPPQSTPGSCWRRGRWLILFAACTLALGCDEAGVSPYGRPSVKVPDASIELATNPTTHAAKASIKPRSEIENLESSAKAGNYKAQFDLGIKYLEGKDVAQDDFNARKWLTLAAERGHATAQYQLGLRHANSGSIIHDSDAAAKWLKRAAGQEVADAQFQLGKLYLDGRVPSEGRDLLNAAQWFNKAAGKGHAAAMLQLGLMHANGMGMPTNRVEAANFYEQAALLSNSTAQRLLGEALYNGIGRSRDASQAARWFESAAVNGDQRAMLSLAGQLSEGEGIGKDLVKAYILYKLVAANPDPRIIDIKTAQQNVRNLEAVLPREELAEGQRRVNEILKTSGKPLAGPRP